MPTALDNIGAKIERSYDHVVDLTERIKVVFDKQYIIRRYHDEATGDYVEIFDDEIIIPMEWSVLAGEVVYQLRSSLDHLVWALVERNGNIPTASNMFPICIDGSRKDIASLERKVKGVSAVAEEIIRSVQPFNSTAPSKEPLAKLNKLNNTDKHRKLNIIAGYCVKPSQLHITGTFRANIRMGGGSILKRGAELFRLKSPPPDLKANIQHTFLPVFDEISSSEIESVVPLLAEMHNSVLDVIRLFLGEFR